QAANAADRSCSDRRSRACARDPARAVRRSARRPTGSCARGARRGRRGRRRSPRARAAKKSAPSRSMKLALGSVRIAVGAPEQPRQVGTLRRVAALTAVVVALVVVVVLLSGGGGYVVRMRLDNASQLVKGDLVQVSGTSVG